MIKEDLISLDSPERWRAALDGVKHSFGHTWENCHAMYLTAGFRTFLYRFQSDCATIVCPISEREYGGYVDIVKPSGFSGFVGNGADADLSRRWKDFAESQGYVCGFIGLNPIFDCGAQFDAHELYPSLIDQHAIYVWDITPGEEELFANLSTNRKRQLKDWERISSDFIHDRDVLKQFFLDNFHNFYADRNALGTYCFSKATFSYILNMDNVFLVGAKSGGKLVAVSVFGYTPYDGEYLFNISPFPEGQTYAAPLIWYGVKRLKSLQVPHLNLGGGWGNLAEFKRRFGAKGYPVNNLKQVYRPEVYRELCSRANVDPDDMSGFFPAYRRK